MAAPSFSSTCAPSSAPRVDRYHISDDRQGNLEWRWLSFFHPCHSLCLASGNNSFNFSLLSLFRKCLALTLKSYNCPHASLRNPVRRLALKKSAREIQCNQWMTSLTFQKSFGQQAVVGSRRSVYQGWNAENTAPLPLWRRVVLSSLLKCGGPQRLWLQCVRPVARSTNNCWLLLTPGVMCSCLLNKPCL